jgi:hypothetical protein
VTAQRQSLFPAAGALFGAALLTRESALFFVGPVLVYILMSQAPDRAERDGELRSACVPQASRGRPALGQIWRRDAARTPPRRRRYGQAALCVAGMAPFLLVMAWYNWLRSGSPFVEAYHATGHFAQFDRLPIRGLFGLLLSPGRGLFEYQPVLLLLIVFPSVAVIFWRKHRGLAALFATVIVITILFYGGFRQWDGGLSWGPRYLLPIIPLLLLPLGELLERFTRWTKLAFGLLLGISILIQLSSVLVDHQIWFHEVAVRNAQGEHIAINSNPGNSPILHQWISLAKVIAPARFGQVQGITAAEKTDPPFATPDDYATGFDFWWLRRDLGRTGADGRGGALQKQ